MSLFRQALAVRSAIRPTILHAPRTTFQATQSRFATGDYGSGDGDPRGEKPQEQGKSETTRKMEHPGPAAPDVGQKHGSSKGSSSSDNQGKQSEKSPEGSEKANKTVNGNQPKILADNPPPPSEQSESVKQHNAELDKRKDKPTASVSNEDAENDKVNPKTWAGQTSG